MMTWICGGYPISWQKCWIDCRGRKLNPLRHRLDSYDYTVEQHVVGSLLFTPILLLLPTTSAFYIFFTILHTAVCFVCIVVGAAISLIHSTPYAKVFLWLKRRKRFPSGILFKVALCQQSETEAVVGSSSSSINKSTILVSFLDSNYLKLGKPLSVKGLGLGLKFIYYLRSWFFAFEILDWLKHFFQER